MKPQRGEGLAQPSVRFQSCSQDALFLFSQWLEGRAQASLWHPGLSPSSEGSRCVRARMQGLDHNPTVGVNCEGSIETG